jgi:hypothetical protein
MNYIKITHSENYKIQERGMKNNDVEMWDQHLVLNWLAKAIEQAVSSSKN